MMMFLRRIGGVLSITWSFLRILPQWMVGSWKLLHLQQPIVTVFGGKRLEPDSVYEQLAFTMGEKLAREGISVVTGGGPGVMRAANCGAAKGAPHKSRSMGIGVRGLNIEEPKNACVQQYLQTDYFPVRKHFLTYYSSAFIIFPGGFGTLDELFEMLVLMQTKKRSIVPVVLIGKEYWQPLLTWIGFAVDAGFVPQGHAAFIELTDDLDHALQCAVSSCKNIKITHQ